jgi:hypothetical protein
MQLGFEQAGNMQVREVPKTHDAHRSALAPVAVDITDLQNIQK